MCDTRRRLFLFPGGALLIGAVRDNEPHRHHAVQLVVSPEPFEITVGGESLRTRCVLIAADVEHALSGDHERQHLLLLDCESREAEELGRLCLSDVQYHLVEDDLLRKIRFDAAPESCAGVRSCVRDLLRGIFDLADAAAAPAALDERIVAACRYIAEQEDLRAPLEDVADHVGLSNGRFTHLFKDQIGIPLRRYILWLRVRRAIEAATTLPSLTDAAHAAGFADQAHFTRTFRDMFGLTPGESLSRARAGVDIQLCSGFADG